MRIPVRLTGPLPAAPQVDHPATSIGTQPASAGGRPPVVEAPAGGLA